MKNILICLEKLNIGGVETFVLNQASVLLKEGHKVVILAKKGIFTEKLQQEGAICLDFEFELGNQFYVEKIKNIEEIIKKYKINEVHINQFPCILSAMPAAIFSNVPYTAYSHNTIDDGYDWFMSTFDIYKYILPLYFMNAYKIIAITKHAKEEIIRRFSIEPNKIQIVNNSINFDEVDSIRKEKKNSKKNFLLVSRLDNEKWKSLYNAIELFHSCQEKIPDAKLDIIGDGDDKQKLQDYISENKIENVNFKGISTNVIQDMNDCDIILGLDRCILEALSMKKIAIILGYNELKGIVTPDNIQEASIENFSGNNLTSKNKEEIIKNLIHYKEDEINEITQGNYEFVKERFDAKINYSNSIQENATSNVPIYFIDLLKLMINRQEKSNEERKNLKNQIDKLQKEKIKLQESMELQGNNLTEEIYALKKEIKEIYSSKRWRYAEKISKFLYKKN